ncbi:MAG TPA: ferritin-like domain-containing protein [Candidatus Cybelea sp.]|nr:ferritin-like domain-containing protein [Candidatus Cybelea sp.]
MNTLKHLFLAELADRYDAEKRLVRAMPKMEKTATCKHLQKLIQSHLQQTVGHVKKLEKIFGFFDAAIKTKKCEATIGLLKEGDEIAAEFKGSPAINAALISVAQKIEHYEIASYGCLREWAGLLGGNESQEKLQEILDEEKAANQALIELARSRSNNEALSECGAADSCSDEKAAKSPSTRRTIRPVKLKRTRAVLA